MSTTKNMCPETILGGGYHPQTHRCQRVEGHEGQCSWQRSNGMPTRWWGANPQPIWSLTDLGAHELRAEVRRLRRLCDEAGIDWEAGLKVRKARRGS